MLHLSHADDNDHRPTAHPPPRLDWSSFFAATSRSSRRPVQVATVVEEANEEERRRDVIEESENGAVTRTGRSSRLCS